MTTNPSYISSTLDNLPDDVKIICPTEVAKEFADNEQVVDCGFTHDELVEDLEDVTAVVTSTDPWEVTLYQDDVFKTWINDSYVYRG